MRCSIWTWNLKERQAEVRKLHGQYFLKQFDLKQIVHEKIFDVEVSWLYSILFLICTKNTDNVAKILIFLGQLWQKWKSRNGHLIQKRKVSVSSYVNVKNRKERRESCFQRYFSCYFVELLVILTIPSSFLFFHLLFNHVQLLDSLFFEIPFRFL